MCKDCSGEQGNSYVNTSSKSINGKLLKNLKKYRKRFDIDPKEELSIKDSKVEGKRFALYVNGDLKANFGSMINEDGEYTHAKTFLDLISVNPGLAMKKKHSYIARASKIKSGDSYAYNLRYSPNSLSYWLLWHCELCH